MALPRYKLQTTEAAEIIAPEQFPFLLVPSDPPAKFGRIRNFFLSGFLSKLIGLIAGTAAAGLIWLWFEPLPTVLTKYMKFSPPQTLGGILAGGISLLLLIALIKNRIEKAAEKITPSPTIEMPPLSLTNSKPSVTDQTWVEWRCEEWSSTPFTEILPEAVIAEVFPDEMIAPDRMIFICQVIQKPKAA